MNWIERRVIQRLWKRGYRLISLSRLRDAEDAVGPQIVDHRCADCGGMESECSPSYVAHTETCEAVTRLLAFRKALRWPY